MSDRCKHGFIAKYCATCIGARVTSKSQQKRICTQSDCVVRDELREQLDQSQSDLEQANKDRLPKNWGLRRHVKGEIVVSHKDGSGVLIREDADKISESLFYRMMSQILDGGGTNTSEALEKANKDIQVLAEALSEAVIVLKEVRSIHGLKSDLPDAFELIANKYKDKT